MTQAPTYAVYREADGSKTPDEINARESELFAAILSNHRGAARPAYAVAGTVWPSDVTEQLFYYDGTTDQPIARIVPTPATATSPGEPGDIACDGAFLYICQLADTWFRVAVATW